MKNKINKSIINCLPELKSATHKGSKVSRVKKSIMNSKLANKTTLKADGHDFNKNRSHAISQNQSSNTISNLEIIEERIQSGEPHIKSDLLEYVKRNPRNYKVLKFLSKHYNVEYDFVSNKWKVKDESEENLRRERVKSFDAREQEYETVKPQRSPQSPSQSLNNLSTQICQILNSAYENDVK